MNSLLKKGAMVAAAATLVGSITLLLPVFAAKNSSKTTTVKAVNKQKTKAPSTSAKNTASNSLDPYNIASLNPSHFQVVANTSLLELLADPQTGQFMVKDKRNGNIWRSFPDPKTITTAAQNKTAQENLLSPLAFSYINLSSLNPLPSNSNFARAVRKDTTHQTKITGWKKIQNGFELTFSIPSKQLSIPIQVTIKHSYVQTKVINKGIKEGKDKLVYIEVYPFFGAEQSMGQKGYIFIPDGSGALINFVNNRMDQNNYTEPVYGTDMAFPTSYVDSRLRITMPVYGMRSANKGFLAVITQGAEYDQVVASPSPLYTRYNWVSAELDYRTAFQQPTSHFNNPTSPNANPITAYNHTRFGSNRITRYYLLNTGHEGYVGMASRYRQYLMKHYGLQRLKPKSPNIPLYLNLVGGDYQHGFIWNTFIPTTTTSQAIKIVKHFIQKVNPYGTKS